MCHNVPIGINNDLCYLHDDIMLPYFFRVAFPLDLIRMREGAGIVDFWNT